jgi:hypothetical protein
MQTINTVFMVVVWVLLIGMVLLFFAMVAGMIWTQLRYMLGFGRVSPEERKKAEDEFHARLLDPLPDSVEVLLGGKLPTSVLELYADHDLLLKSDICFVSPHGSSKDEEWYVAFFTPCQIEDQRHPSLSSYRDEDDDDIQEYDSPFFEFACNGCGDFFYVLVSDERQDDAPVYYFDHDGGELKGKVADSLREFLSWPITELNEEKMNT